jgi:hypothetical protein
MALCTHFIEEKLRSGGESHQGTGPAFHQPQDIAGSRQCPGDSRPGVWKSWFDYVPLPRHQVSAPVGPLQEHPVLTRCSLAMAGANGWPGQQQGWSQFWCPV